MTNLSQDMVGDPFFEPILQSAQTIYGQAGTPEAKMRLREAAAERLRRLGLDSFSAYAAHLRREPAEWDALWALALPAYGAFLRPALQFDVAREVISEWAVMSPERELKVLSLGCGPGFETVSLAICLEESGLRAKNWQVDIYGLDLNPESVRLAESGLFTSDDLEWLTDGQRRKWFSPRGGGFYFRAELASPIKAAKANIYDPTSWPMADLNGSFDLIFCRGLSLETPARAIPQLARILRQALAPSGFIFTAPGEFLPLVADDISLEERSGVTYYRRGQVKIKVNRHHQPRRQKNHDQAVNETQAGPNQESLPPREAQLLSVAEEEMAKGHLEAARALVDEAVLAALERESPAPEAWKLAARIEERLGRTDTARATLEAAKAVAAVSGQ